MVTPFSRPTTRSPLPNWRWAWRRAILVISDTRVKGKAGTDLIHQLRERLPTLPVLLVANIVRLHPRSSPHVSHSTSFAQLGGVSLLGSDGRLVGGTRSESCKLRAVFVAWLEVYRHLETEA